MKALCITTLCITITCCSFAQLGNKPLSNKLPAKNLGTSISVKPGNLKLKDIGLPKNFDINKTSKLEVPAGKLKLPSRKKIKITPIRPYDPNLEFSFEGRYSKNYFMPAGIFGGLLTFNAQQGKEYRVKVSLADKKYLEQDIQTDFSNGHVGIDIGGSENLFTITVNQSQRQFSFVFTAAQTGQIQIILYGIFTRDWQWGDELWMAVKSIEVDEI